MIHAELRGKLSDSAGLSQAERWEDVLTSSVFGLLRYLPPAITLDFLTRARDAAGHAFALGTVGDAVTLEFLFWPTPPGWDREPDVVIDVILDGHRYQRWVVEAKYLSGKSQREDDADEGEASVGDQLADQLRAARRNFEIGNVPAAEPPVLFYLTADFDMPRAAVEESVEQARGHGAPANIYWLGWWALHACLAGFDSGHLIASDLRALLTRRGQALLDSAWNRDWSPPASAWSLSWIATSSIRPGWWTAKIPEPRTPWRFQP